ncbi:glycerophosphodiester phosphodiesterase family protein [uncultured Actinomyces sp.]|uniref:glycerophosphodiester phosphodiesterase family protein n=1 Tax=uncultured Actinomyces sp. TaxID=249061 RepID=UPI0028F02020|nr:glycerophosphodiester phosphodiesterase family protein [uncultured Actinomyces sp.]
MTTSTDPADRPATGASPATPAASATSATPAARTVLAPPATSAPPATPAVPAAPTGPASSGRPGTSQQPPAGPPPARHPHGPARPPRSAAGSPAAFAPTGPSAPVPPGTRTVLAHRGASALAPENTLAAYRLAADHGARWVELDVDVISDGTIIVIHDSRLDRTTNRTGPYYGLTAADLPTIDAGSWFHAPAASTATGRTAAGQAPPAPVPLTPVPASPSPFAGEPLPTLAQALELLGARGVGVNVELKSCQAGATACRWLVDGVAELLDAHARAFPGCEVLVSSFNPVLLDRMGARRPLTRRALLVERGLLLDDWRSYAEILGVEAVNPADAGLERGRVEEIRSLGYGVNVWTVNSRRRAEELFEWGVTGVFTDRVHELGDLERGAC